MSLKEKFIKFLKFSFKDKILALAEYSYTNIQNYMNFKWKYYLIVDNRNNYDNLLIIVAWYQDYIYDKVLERVQKNMEPNIDVCVVTPWKKDEELIKYCSKYWWSYLCTKDNKLSLAQNIAIKLHRKAQFIYKMDEDIFITEWFFSNLKEKYQLTIENSEFIPWAITPVININGFTYSYFLKTINKKEEFEKNFSKIKQEVWKEWKNIRYSGEIAEYMRKNTLPIDKTQERFFKNIDISKTFNSNSVKYSIWCFMIPRYIWEGMGWFDVAFEWWLWKEETQFLSYTINESRPIILCENCLCWHFSFGPQKRRMKDFFEKNRDLF
jgi:hypothetical protein